MDLTFVIIKKEKIVHIYYLLQLSSLIISIHGILCIALLAIHLLEQLRTALHSSLTKMCYSVQHFCSH